MTIGFPSGLEWLGWVIGMEWPEADEDSLWRIADAWSDAATDFDGLTSQLDAAATSILDSIDGEMGAAVEERLAELVSGDGSPAAIAEAARLLAAMSDATATNVEYTKLMFYAQLIVLALEIALAYAEAVPTLGASLLQIPIFQAIARVAVRLLTKELLEKITATVARRVALKIVTTAAGAAALNAAIAAAMESAVQGFQLAKGSRKDVDWGQLGKSTLTEAIGGAAAGPVGLAGRRFVSEGSSRLGRMTSNATLGGLEGLTSAAASMGSGVALFGDQFDMRALLGGGLSGAIPGGVAGLRGGPTATDVPTGRDGGTDSSAGDRGSQTGAGHGRGRASEGGDQSGTAGGDQRTGATQQQGTTTSDGAPATHRADSTATQGDSTQNQGSSGDRSRGSDQSGPPSGPQTVTPASPGSGEGGGPAPAQNSTPAPTGQSDSPSTGEIGSDTSSGGDGPGPAPQTQDSPTPQTRDTAEQDAAGMGPVDTSGAGGDSGGQGGDPGTGGAPVATDSTTDGPTQTSEAATDTTTTQDSDGPGPGPDSQTVTPVTGGMGAVGPVAGASTSQGGSRAGDGRSGDPSTAKRDGSKTEADQSLSADDTKNADNTKNADDTKGDDTKNVDDTKGDDDTKSDGVPRAQESKAAGIDPDVALNLDDPASKGAVADTADTAVTPDDGSATTEVEGTDSTPVDVEPDSTSDANSERGGDKDKDTEVDDGSTPPPDTPTDDSGNRPQRPDVQKLFAQIAEKHGFTPQQLLDVVNRLAESGQDGISGLSKRETAALVEFADRVPLPDINVDLMQKVIPASQAQSIWNETQGKPYDPAGRYTSDTVGGYVSVASDMQALLNSQDGTSLVARITEALRLDYDWHKSEPAFRPDASELYLIEGTIKGGELKTPNRALYEQNALFDPDAHVPESAMTDTGSGPPHTRSGMPGSAHYASPEYKLTEPGKLKAGAELVRVEPDGTRTVVARLVNDEASGTSRWERVDPNWAPDGPKKGGLPLDTMNATEALKTMRDQNQTGEGQRPDGDNGKSRVGETENANADSTIESNGDGPEGGPANDGSGPNDSGRGEPGRCAPDVIERLRAFFGREIDALPEREVGANGMTGRELEARVGGELRVTSGMAELMQRLRELGPGSAAILAVEHSPHVQAGEVGAHAYSVTNRNGVIEVWDPATRSRVELPENFDVRAWAIAFDPNGNPIHPRDHVTNTPGEGALDAREPGDRGPVSRIGGLRDDLVGQAPMPEGHPRPIFDNEVDVPAKDLPGKRKPFASLRNLDPNTLYHVEGRGDFYTDHNGRVVFVEATYGVKGQLNWDLNRPQPDITYVVHPDVADPIPGVSHAHVFQTDHLGRLVYAHTDALALGEASRSESIQTRVGDEGGPGYDGGHVFGNYAGGGPESLNLFAMLESVNRGSGESFYNLEGIWRTALGGSPPPVIPVTIKPIFGAGSTIPTEFLVKYQIGNLKPRERTFINEH